MTDQRVRLKSAELLSIAAASVLGAGVALVFQRWLAPFAAAIALAGLIVHAGGMYEKHRIEAGAGVKVALWETWLYWFCLGTGLDMAIKARCHRCLKSAASIGLSAWFGVKRRMTVSTNLQIIDYSCCLFPADFQFSLACETLHSVCAKMRG